MSKREASMFAAQGVVDVDAPRAKRHKPGPQASSISGGQSSSPAKDEQFAVGDGREVKQEQLDSAAAAEEVVAEDPETVKEKGTKVWQAVKDAVNKEGLVLSADFLRLPSRRQYADYYALIKHPVSLDEIKQRLDEGAYLSFNDCINELETCFKNAKRYNMRDSPIWKSAKILHKIVTQEAARFSGKIADDPEDLDAPGAPSDAEGEGKKKKQPIMGRLLKTRLQKLVDKTNSDGRVLSTEFMELPNRKQWAVYYKAIKKPQCLENIFKKLKRKEYHTTLDFANDVELVFSNALDFNQEHTGIWEDAVVLRDYFRQLMADLPPPFTIAAYASSDHSTKIKLRVPYAVHPPQPVAGNNSNPTGGTLMLRVPPQASPSSFTPQLPNSNSINVKIGKSPKVTPAMKTLPLAPETTHPTPTPVGTSQSPYPHSVPGHAASPANQSQPQQITFAQSTFPSSYASSSQYSSTAYHPPRQSSQTRTPTVITTTLPSTSVRQSPSTPVQTQVLNLTPATKPIATVPTTTWSQPIVPRPPMLAMAPTPAVTYAAPAIGTATAPSKSPTPVTASRQRKLEYVVVTTKPNGRRIDLDARHGVKTWAVRLGVNELSVSLSGVRFFAVEEEKADMGGMDVDGSIEARKEEEEEEEEQPPAEAVKAVPKRGRGRPRKKPLLPAPEPVQTVPTSQPVSSTLKGKGNTDGFAGIQVRLNGNLARPRTESEDEWEVKVPVGYNVLEIGEIGGVTWRVYLERMGVTAGVRSAQ